MRQTFAIAGLIAFATAATAQEPLSVHVTGGVLKSQTKEEEAQLRAKSDAARTARDAVKEAGEKQYGKDLEKWPGEKVTEFKAANSAFFEAQTAWFYTAGLKQKDIDDSVAELKAALEKKSVRTVSTPAEADLLVQVLGRAKVNASNTTGSVAQVALRVEPGSRMDAAALASSGAAWNEKKGFMNPDKGTEVVHDLTAAAPYWIMISSKPGMAWSSSYKAAAGEAAEAFQKFWTENKAKLAGTRRAAQ